MNVFRNDASPLDLITRYTANKISQIPNEARIASLTKKKAPDHWHDWVQALFPFIKSFAPYHKEFYTWLWAIKKGTSPSPFIGIWPRDTGKSTHAEIASVAVGALGVRQYVWYIRETQDQADDSVQNISDILEDDLIASYYPDLSEREVGKFGKPKAWRRNRLRTKKGLIVDAVGFDTAVRGARQKDARPDFIIFDDIDNKQDSLKATKKKIETLTTSILPAGSRDCAILGIQNLIIAHGIFSKLAGVHGDADFLTDRIVSGPHPDIIDLEVETRQNDQGRIFYLIIGGTPTWPERGIKQCQINLNKWGYSSYLQEAQHEVTEQDGGHWSHIEFQTCPFDEVPEIVRGSVWVDPTVTETDASDSTGIIADAIGVNGNIYRFFAMEKICGPTEALTIAILKCLELGFDTVGVETDQGGDLWYNDFKQVWKSLIESVDYPHIDKRTTRPRFQSAKAGAGHGSKVHRNHLMRSDYEKGRVIHVIGSTNVLEKALKRFPIKPLDLADASYWGWYFLRHGGSVDIMGAGEMADELDEADIVAEMEKLQAELEQIARG